MTYKDNTLTYNVGRKVVNFKDFVKPKEEAELKMIKRQNKPNSERQQLIGNPRTKYNKVTHKLDMNLNPAYIEDKIKSIEESHIDDQVLENIQNSEHYEKFQETINIAVQELFADLTNDDSLGFDDGDNDHYESFKMAVQEAVNGSLGSV
jgi:hypothetical protein